MSDLHKWIIGIVVSLFTGVVIPLTCYVYKRFHSHTILTIFDAHYLKLKNKVNVCFVLLIQNNGDNAISMSPLQIKIFSRTFYCEAVREQDTNQVEPNPLLFPITISGHNVLRLYVWCDGIPLYAFGRNFTVVADIGSHTISRRAHFNVR